MFKPTLIPSPEAAALCRVAYFNGVQCGINDEPLFELWTLTKSLSPQIIANSTFTRDFILEAIQTEKAAA